MRNLSLGLPVDGVVRRAQRLRTSLLAIFGGFMLTSAVGEAASYALNNTEVLTPPQSANGRSYVLYVRLPESYVTSPARRYPVVYACDGYWDFPLLGAMMGNLRVDGAMPECILVGIGYAGTNPDVGALRAWDLTPGVDPSANAASVGHASEFLNVIASQFIPLIERTYRVDASFRVLTGSSYGGLFTLYALFERPGLFQGYVAPSPSLWWRSEHVLSRARAYAEAGGGLNARVFTTYATQEFASIVSTTRHFAQVVPNLGISGLSLAVRAIEGEGHSGTKAEAFNRGLRFVCANVAPQSPSPLTPGFGSRSTLVNLSTRGRVDRGESALIGGIVVAGINPKRLLIRAAGPALADHGVAEPLADPRFRVVDADDRVVAANDNWSDAADRDALQVATAQSGAFPFLVGSRDAAMVVTLEPGNYTIVVESVDDTPGIGLVEAYELLP